MPKGYHRLYIHISITDKELKAMCSSSDPDKDVDCVTGPGLDVGSCQRAFQYLAKVSL